VIDTVLFDLDGTLLDTAADMTIALNLLSAEHGGRDVRLEHVRDRITAGASAMIELAVGMARDATDSDRHNERFLDLYRDNLGKRTRLFPGMGAVLDALEENGIVWGICTNKPAWLTDPLLAALKLDGRTACAVSGDTLPHSKPRPEPLWHALELCGDRSPARSLFVGDARRDIEAGRAAGIRTVAALYGYLEPGEEPRDWQADHYIDAPDELLEVVGLKKRAAS
jgi:phosphoglycolate phosphatase